MKILSILIVIFLVASCNSKRLVEQRQDFKNLTSDSLLLKELAANTKALNIPQIINGVDSFELRIWHGITIATPKQLTVLKYQDSSWTLTRTDYWFTYQWKNGRPDKVSTDSAFTQSLKLTYDISELVDSIYQFRLDTLLSQTDIPGFQDRVADGMFYVFEIATPHFYKALAYNNPDKYIDSYNKKITRLIVMLGKIGVYSMP